MKKLMVLLLAMFAFNIAQAQPVGVGFQNMTPCTMDVTIYANDVNNSTCGAYTSVIFSVPPGQSLYPWSSLTSSTLWSGGVVPDFPTIVVDHFCADYTSSSCFTIPTCVGMTGCAPSVAATLGSTCACKNFNPIGIDYSISNMGFAMQPHYKLKIQ